MPSDLTEFLKPKILAQVESLELVAKFIVEGFMIGLHRSPYHGFSVEFSSYREYSPGDELRFIDWRVFARSDKFYVKQFEETTNLNCYIALDQSASMGYSDALMGPARGREARAGDTATNGVSKVRYCSFIAAALAYLMLKQGDAVGLATFDSSRFDFLPASSKSIQLYQVLSRLTQVKPDHQTELKRSLTNLSERIRRRSLIVLLTDLLVDPEELYDGLRYSRYRHHEIIIFQVLSEHERTFPFQLQTNFVDSESGEQIVTEPGYIRKEYLRLLDAHVAAVKDTCEEMNVDFLSLSTADWLGEVLMTYLARRTARM